MNMYEIQGLSFLLIPKNDKEMDLLKSYHAHLMSQVSKMELHPLHKQDVQKLLTKSITVIIEHCRVHVAVKPAGLYTRIRMRLFKQKQATSISGAVSQQ